jgi:hypothetical protein
MEPPLALYAVSGLGWDYERSWYAFVKGAWNLGLRRSEFGEMAVSDLFCSFYPTRNV